METAALTDAIRKAERVAPSSAGQAFDKAAGIVMEVSRDVVVIKATDLDVYSMEWVEVLEADEDETVWRLPSKVFAMVCGSLPIGSGKTVELREENKGHHSQVILKSGRTTARFNLLNHEYYPQWQAFDPDDLIPVMDLGGRLSQIEWACDKSNEPLNGVNLTGEWAYATDKYRLARVPLEVPGIEGSITIPPSILAGLLKQTGEVSIKISGSQLYVMPDEHSQIRCVIFGLEYPNVHSATRIELPDKIEFRKAELLEIMGRALNFSGSDRFPVMECFVGKEEFAVMMSNDEIGLLGDRMSLSGQAAHDRLKVLFTPKNLMDALDKAPSDRVEVFYDAEKSTSPWRVDGGSGFSAWVMPRKEMST